MNLRILFIFALSLATAGCGQTVSTIDLQDENVPIEARRFVADAQDAVSIARARRDDASRTLAFTREWKSELLAGEMWPKGSGPTVQQLEKFTDARVRMAELFFEQAETRLELAEAKYTLSTAETAMRNDLAVYDLEPLRAETDSIRDELERIAGEIEDQRIKVDKLTLAWWKDYKDFMSKEQSLAFYVDPELLAEIKETQAEREKMRAEAKKEAEKKGEKGDEKDAKTTEEEQEETTISEEDKIDLDL